MKLLSFIFVVLVAFSAEAKITISSPVFNGTFSSVTWNYNENISGVMAVPPSLMSFGNIVFLPIAIPGFPSVVSLIHYFQQNLLPKAIVFIQVVPGAVGYDAINVFPWQDVAIPIISVEVSALDLWFQVNGTDTLLFVEIEQEANIWKDVAESGVWWAGRYLIAAAHLSALVIAIIRLIQFTRNGSFPLTVATVSLASCIASCAITLVWFLVDPAWSNVAYNPDLQLLLANAGLLYVLVALFISTFFWHELITLAKVRVSTFISGFRVPFLCICVFVLIVGWLLGIFRFVFYFELWILSLADAFAGVMMGLFGIFLIYMLFVSISVLLFLQKKGTIDRRLKTFTIRMAVNVLSIVLILVGYILSFAGLAVTPFGLKYVVFIAYCGASIALIATPLSFQPPQSKQTHSGTTMSSVGSKSAN